MSSDDAFMRITDDEIEHFRPINGMVLVEVSDEDLTIGSLVIVRDPDSRRKDVKVGTVIKSSMTRLDGKRESRYVGPHLLPGEKVYLDKYAGHDIVAVPSLKRYVVASESDVLAVAAA